MLERIDSLIDMLEVNSELLWKNEQIPFAKESQNMINEMMTLLPEIIGLYSDEKMTDLASDAVYWPSQLQKIIDLLGYGKDVIAIADALYFEMRANLIEFRTVIVERNLV